VAAERLRRAASRNCALASPGRPWVSTVPRTGPAPRRWRRWCGQTTIAGLPAAGDQEGAHHPASHQRSPGAKNAPISDTTPCGVDLNRWVLGFGGLPLFGTICGAKLLVGWSSKRWVLPPDGVTEKCSAGRSCRRSQQVMRRVVAEPWMGAPEPGRGTGPAAGGPAAEGSPGGKAAGTATVHPGSMLVGVAQGCPPGSARSWLAAQIVCQSGEPAPAAIPESVSPALTVTTCRSPAARAASAGRRKSQG